MSRVMIVEDDEDVRESLAQVLVDEGHDVEACRNGTEAIRTLVEQGHKPCIVLLDLVMPQVTGLDVLRKLREAGVMGRSPVFVMTGTAGDPPVPPGVPVLRKPFDLHQLLAVVAEHCGSSTQREAGAEATPQSTPGTA
jgi:CheY-like chemotaxis protein